MKYRLVPAIARVAILATVMAIPATVAAVELPPVLFPPAATDADFPPRHQAQEELGKLLFFDKILSGNFNISCATCHHSMAATGDGLSLSVGEGGAGLGVTRDTGLGPDAVPERVPRNAPHVFNLGALEFERLFHDGRVSTDPSQPSGFRSPAGDDLPSGLASPLAAQAMFPVTSGTEMAGQPGENAVADAAAAGDLAGPSGVWPLLAARLQGIPEYVELFIEAFDDVASATDITYVHAANAIAAFEAAAWRADDSPFDRFLRGDVGALSANQIRGMELFYGAAGCAECHRGTFQTSHGFRAIGMPQIGPGKGDGDDGHADFGREQVTADPDDRMRFRVPPLRNIALTAPYGHDGAFDDLRAVIHHHMRPRHSLLHYDRGQAVLPSRADLDAVDFMVMDDPAAVQAIWRAIEIPVLPLPEEDVDRLLDFLYALTDRGSLDLRDDTPKRLPSGLPLFD